MSRAKRLAAAEKELRALEGAFEERLMQALALCESGTWGLFGQNDASLDQAFGENRIGYKSDDAQYLLAAGEEIDEARAKLGLEKSDLVGRFLAYRAMRGSNTPGEPKLASQFLAELGGR